MIIAHNEAGLKFGLSNGVRSPADIGPGIDYPGVCRKTVKGGHKLAQQAIAGIQAVLDRKMKAFQLEHPCDSHPETRWFLMKTVPL